MTRQNLLVFLRQFRKSPGLSFLSVCALALGIGCWLVTWVYISDELSFDRTHQDLDRLFRVGVTFQDAGGLRSFPLIAVPVGPALKQSFPEVQYAARVLINTESKVLVRYRDRAFFEDGVVRAEPDLVRILTIPFVQGDPQTALERPGTMALTQQMAKKYFGGDNPVGQTIFLNDSPLEISAVLKDAPDNTHLKYRFLVSLKDYPFKYTDQWHMTVTYTYLKLAPGVDVGAFARKMRDFTDRFSPPLPGRANPDLFLRPVRDIHLRSHLPFEIEAPGNMSYLYIALALGLLTLLIAALNFSNLLIARAGDRNREVGVRKALGAQRRELSGQFLFEALATSLLALALALLLVGLALPLVGTLLNKTYSLEHALRPGLLLAALAVTLLTGFAAGAYPAFVLSGLPPGLMIRKALMPVTRRIGLRKVLLALQFAISIVFIISTLMVSRQLQFMKNRPLGFEKTQKLVLPVRNWPGIRILAEAVKNEFTRQAGVQAASFSSSIPGREMSTYGTRFREDSWDKYSIFFYVFVDFDFVGQYQIRMAAGRPFRRDMGSDPAGTCLINRAAVKALGLSSAQAALGRTLVGGNDGNQMRVIGVTEDFHYKGLHSPVEPLVLELLTSPFGADFGAHSFLTLTVETARSRQVLAFVEKEWRRLNPRTPFEYFFLDSDFNSQYQNDERLGKLIAALTVIGIAIACLGLLGMMAFATQRRRKEMAVRKIVGASTLHITGRLHSEFAWLLLWANVLAWPLAYVAVSRWLQGFAYRASISPWIFLAAGSAALLCALLTVSCQAIRAARANPVDSLRYE